MTTSQYSNTREWTSGYVNRPFESLLTSTGRGAKREAHGAFSNAGLITAHVLTHKSPELEFKDNFVENAYREFAEFEASYHQRRTHRRLSLPPPYTPTDFLNL